MPSLWVLVSLLGLCLLGEAPTWRSYRRRVARSEQDGRSSAINAALGVVSLIGGCGSAWLLRETGALATPGWLAWSGIPVCAAGVALRAWSMVRLGDLFTLTVQVRAGQPVAADGPYRFVRHPSYAGGELALLGAGLAAGNWLSPALFVLPWTAAHLHRMRVEERALLAVLGHPYQAYMSRTKRLIPYIY